MKSMNLCIFMEKKFRQIDTPLLGEQNIYIALTSRANLAAAPKEYGMK